MRDSRGTWLSVIIASHMMSSAMYFMPTYWLHLNEYSLHLLMDHLSHLLAFATLPISNVVSVQGLLLVA